MSWKYWLAPTLVVLILAVLPQVNMWLAQGSDRQGAYVVSNYDEVAYSGYINSLISGKSRRNDPFTGKDELGYESLYSIQAVPPYVISTVASVFGLSASNVFVLLNFLIPIFSALAIFLLIRAITGNDLIASVGVVFVLCLGAAVAFQGELQHMILGNYLCDFFPYLRRYQPGFAFPSFFLFVYFVWRSFTSRASRQIYLAAIGSGVIFAALVFSYFFLWTAALAWFCIATALWVAFHPESRGKTLKIASIVGAFAAGSIIPYFILLSNRTQNTDDVQLLIRTRAPQSL